LKKRFSSGLFDLRDLRLIQVRNVQISAVIEADAGTSSSWRSKRGISDTDAMAEALANKAIKRSDKGKFFLRSKSKHRSRLIIGIFFLFFS
jgi:hypothetical protein